MIPPLPRALLLLGACAAGLDDGLPAAGRKAAAGRPEKALFAASVTFDPGADEGQNFGSLFEAKDGRGRVVAGAGFMAVYNTRFRMDRHVVQFFARPPLGDAPVKMQRLPRPDDDAGLYMFDFDGKLFAINEVTGRFFQEWDAASARWQRATGAAAPLESSGDGLTRVGRGVLRWVGGQVEYEGRVILPAPAEGRYSHFYYAQGRLFFYHTHQGAGEEYTRLYACPWTPAGGPIQVSRGDALTIAPAGSVTWAFGQHGRQVLTVSNYGGVYAHDGRAWRVLREPSPGVSYQVYSMLNYYDRLLLGHYPTGEVLEYDGEALRRREGFPPRLPGVSPQARECQTLAIYRGELFAGVWPWAEVSRYDADAARWHSLGRLFTHPEITDKAVHPYEEEARKLGLVVNDWGQRVTSMIPIGDSLMLSTSAKGNHRWDPRYDFLPESRRREYGAVLQMTLPGNVAAPIRWSERRTRLEFLLFRERMVVRQDGRLVAESRLDPPLAEGLKPARIAWGRGVFGPVRGRLLRARARGEDDAPLPGDAAPAD
jgi:hypothetical protein